MRRAHAMPFGAAVLDPGGVRFRLWAPAAQRVAVLLEGSHDELELPLEPVGGGWFERCSPEAGPGSRYRYLIDGDARVPDPAARFQPEGVHGPSEVVDPCSFDWPDGGWRGRPWHEAVLYEIHLGAFSRSGDYDGLRADLDRLARLGVSALELMPLAECPGARNWGYDGVLPFAPTARHGRPEALKTLVAEAHARKLMVFLDVVYNHFGPEGNFLPRYAPAFFTARHATPWGEAIDFEGPASRPVRDFFIHNALYWIEEYHLDGLRLDAVHAIHDASEPDFLSELADRVRKLAGPERRVHLVLENDRNEAWRLEREGDGRPRSHTAQWNDDLHHALHVLVTGETSGYYEDYAEAPARRLGRCLTEGFAYQGEASRHRGGAPRGEPSGHLPPTAFVGFLQNHDQVGNRAFGERIDRLAAAEAVEAALALLLLAPTTPLLFMGEEWGADEPFPFFCDFGGELAEKVREGRGREFASFPEFRDPAMRARIPDPGAAATFESARLDQAAHEREPHRKRLALVCRLLSLRARQIAPRLAGIQGFAGGFETCGERALRVRWRLGDGARLHLLAQLGPEPLEDLAGGPPPGRRLFASHADLDAWLGKATLPPWSVLWQLEEADQAVRA